MSRFGAAILGCEGLWLGPGERRLFREADPFGFILFGRNIGTADQIRALCDELRDSVGRDAPIFIDQEGGRVQRLRPPLGRAWTPPLEFIQTHGARAGRAMYLRYRIISAELRALGIDGNCAPMLDVARPETHPFLRNRCYGTTVAQVTELGCAVAQGCLEGGVLPVMKHMPGHGLARADSHHDLPRITATPDLLEDVDFAAFEPFSDLPCGMTAHLVYEAYDPAPATISARMIRLIRERLGFDGLLMTDDISMQALSGRVEDRGRASLDAGCDVVLHCNGDLAEMQAVMALAGSMTEGAQARAEATLAARCPAPDVDVAALVAELDGLGEVRT